MARKPASLPVSTGYWLLKSEPDTFSYDDLAKFGKKGQHWDGVRNYQARNNMRGKNEATISPIPLHGDIASRVSTTRETVARVMNDLARQGIVKRTKDSLVINDLERLKHMVEDVRGA